ncbi:MAG: hypothetical protein GY940_28490, partial [bacterium]|nr:hypothetical protein [bacterium]
LAKRNPQTIIPVKLDKTDWVYPNFKDFIYYKIPGGKRSGQYEELKSQLLEAQRQ